MNAAVRAYLQAGAPFIVLRHGRIIRRQLVINCKAHDKEANAVTATSLK